MATVQTGIATDLITFSRTSNATVTDSDGKIKWAPHNLLLASEQFDAASWTKGAASVTANSIASPNGSTTADTLTEDSTTANHRLVYTVVTTNGRHTYSVFVKAGSRDWVYLRLSDSGAVARHAYFNVSTGAIGTVETNLSAQISSVGSGWYLCSVTVSDANAGSNPLVIGVTTADNINSHAGNGTGNIYLSGAHLYRSDLGGMKANTSAYPMYNPTTAKNLLGYTEAVGSWTPNAIVPVSNVLAAPNGLLTADQVGTSTATGAHGFYQTINVNSGMTMSIYAKAGTNEFLGLTNSSSGTTGAVFNVATGTVVSSANCTASITSVGDGWYRCACSNVTISGTFFIVSVQENAGVPWSGFTGTGKYLYLWGAQLSDSASLDAYVPNNGAAPTAAAYYGPRLDYDPVTLAAKGLLVEEARTNALTYSNTFDNAAWVQSRATVTANAATAPDGTAAADLMVPTAVLGTHRVYQTGVSNLATQNWTFSAYLKPSGYNGARLMVSDGTETDQARAIFDLTTGAITPESNVGTTITIVSSSAVAVGSGWYRCSITVSVASSKTAISAWIFSIDAGLSSFTGNGTSGTLMWGAQLEIGSFATSYIPTGAATATRAADVASVSTSQFPYSAIEGAYVANFSTFDGISGLNRIVALTDGTNSNRTEIRNASASEATVVSGGVTSATLDLTNITLNAVTKAGLVYKASDFAATINGATPATASSGAVSANVDRLNIGTSATGVSQLNGHIRQITYIPRRISNTELQARTV